MKTLEFGVTQSSSSSFLLQNAKREDLQKIWWKIQRSGAERSFQDTIQSGIEEVQRSNGQFAFISEELNLNQALVGDCSLGVVGPIDGRSFAVAVAKGKLKQYLHLTPPPTKRSTNLIQHF
jgi:hypothetical protein